MRKQDNGKVVIMSECKKNLKDIRHSIYVIRLLAKRDRQRGNSSAFLGQFWQIINPFIDSVVISLVFTKMFDNGNFIYFPIYILIGTMIYGLFNEGTTSCLTSLSGNKNFLIKSSISRNLYPIERVYVALINFCFSIFIFIIVAWYYGLNPSWKWVLIIPDIILLAIMILGIGKILAIINVVFADITYFYRIFTLFVFYASGIFYNTNRLSPLMQELISLNPVYLSIAIARLSVIDGIIPKWSLWLKLLIYSILLYNIGTYVYNKNVQNIIEKI